MKIFKTIPVDLDYQHYDIIIGRGILSDLPRLLSEQTKNKKVIIVSDTFFRDTLGKQLKERLTENGFKCFEYYMNAGKENKNFNEILKIYGILEEYDFARDSTLIALGGGVVGDLAGFVASTWLRGMNLVHIPTTLLAMVDSSIGGKVAINFRKTINGIGNYYHPILNLIDLDLVDTLPDRDLKSGLAEVIKCAIIDDVDLCTYMVENYREILARDEERIVKCIYDSIKIKLKYVSGDVREGHKRLHLNYGHTLGHSIEISTERNGKEQLRHGEGVSIGTIAVAHIADNYLHDVHTLEDYIELFGLFDLPVFVDSQKLGFNREQLLAECIKNVNKDKKRINNKLRLILSEKRGSASVYSDVPFEYVEKAFNYIIR